MKLTKFRIALEMSIALFAGVLGLLTVFWRDWIEGLTGWDPDHHDGRAEWLIVTVLLAVVVEVGLMARRDWRRLAEAQD